MHLRGFVINDSYERYRKTILYSSLPHPHNFVTNRYEICDFQLVVNSNFGRISQGFGTTVTYWSVASGTYPGLI